MSFNKAIENVKVFDEDPETNGWLPTSKACQIIENLQAELEPVIEMTQEQYDNFQYFKENSENFANPLAQLALSLFKDVSGGDDFECDSMFDVDDSNEIIMYVNAWQHPNKIQVINEEKN